MAAHRNIGWALFLIALAILTSCSSSGSGESDPVMVTVSGRVVDSRGDPVSGATVTIDGVPTAVPTDENGEFSAEVEPGDHEIAITKDPDIIAAIPISVSEGGPGELGDIAPTTSYYPWYEDNDADGFGNATVIVNDENQPIDYVINDDDCDDTAAAIYPGAAEVCDGLDNNCNVDIDEGVLLAFYQDSDTDGYGNQSTESLSCSAPVGYVSDSNDCDDTNAAVNPVAPEVCDGLDNNCNVDVDEGVLGLFFEDADSDTYGNALSSIGACSVPSGFVLDDSDCDDTAASINPGATEICNSVDDNCDAVVDEGLLLSFYQDSDTDGFGNWLVPTQSCSAPGGYVSDDTDCDDMSASIYPGAPEVCNDIDDNCDAQVDEGVSITFYRDADTDTYGSTTNSIEACSNPTGYLTDNTDCDDTEPNLNPETVWYPDGDQDTYPVAGNSLTQCLAPTGSDVPDYLTAAFDCNDSDPSIHPGNIEITGNSIDDDCNSGTLDSAAVFAMADLQGDWKGYGINAGDYASNEWNGWMQVSVSFDNKGQLSDFIIEYDDGLVETDPGLVFLHMDTEGIVTVVGDPMFHGAVSQDGDTLVATYTDIDGGFAMVFLQKSPAVSTLADFEGQWNSNAIVAGDDPGWSGWFRGTVDIVDTGTVRFDFDRSDNDQDAGFIRNELNGDGDLENHWNLRSVSADGQLAIGRADYEGGFGLEVLTRSGGAFASGNLEGDWSFHVLSAGDAPQVNGWGHGMMHFDSVGAGTVTYQGWSDPTYGLAVGTLSVDSAGRILSSTNQTFVGTLSSNKDTIIATFSNQSGGASLLIGLRRNPPPLGIVTEESTSASTAISPAVGGTLQVTAIDGTQFDLTIPPDAIDSDQDVLIKMTPLAGLSGLPNSGSFLGAVQLAPEGLRLSNPATLTVNLPGAVPLTDLLSYVYQGSGSEFQFLPVLPDAGTTSTATFDIPLSHFSGGGGGTGTSGDPVAGIVQEVGVGILDPQNPDHQLIISRFKAAFVDWWDNGVWPRLYSADTAEDLREAIQEYYRWESGIRSISAKYQIWGHYEPLAGWIPDISQVHPTAYNQADSQINETIDAHLMPIQAECRTGEVTDYCWNPSRFWKALPWIDLSQLVAQRGYFTDPGWDRETFCYGINESLAYAMKILGPKYRSIPVHDSADFTAYMENSRGEPRDPVWVSGDPAVASVSDGYVVGVAPGSTTIYAYEPARCNSVHAFVSVGELSGAWNVDIVGRADDNCHYNEPPDLVPIPDVLIPESAGLRFTPDPPPLEGNTVLNWAGRMFMEGSSSNSARFTISGAADETVSAGHLLKFTQSCELTFSGLVFDGSCKFNKIEGWDLTTPPDQCKGKYWITGRRDTAP